MYAMQDAKLSTNIYKKAKLCPADDCVSICLLCSANIRHQGLIVPEEKILGKFE